MGNLVWADYAAIIIYFVAMMLVGLWYSRRQQSLEEYFVGGRGVGTFVVGISMIATLLSAISYLATPGEIVKNGPGLMYAMLSYPLAFLVVGYFVIPRIMKHRVTSAYELLEQRFGLTIRKTISALFVIIRLLWMGLVIHTCSKAVMVIVGMPEKYLSIVLITVGVLATAYTVVGGIRAVMITDVAQFLVLVGGALFALGYVTYRCGGFSWWPDFSSQGLADLNWPTIKFFSFDPGERLTIVSAIVSTGLWWIMVASSDQVVIQRYLCTRNTREARRSFRNCLIGNVVLDVILFAVGLAMVGFFLVFPNELPQHAVSIAEQADDLFPHFIGCVMPAGLSGVVVAALFAASMSSMDSGISSIGTVLLTDFQRFARSCHGDERKLLRRARTVGIIIGAVAIVLSHLVQYVPGGNLLEVCIRLGYFFEVPIFVLFFMAFFVPFSTPQGGWTAIVVGFFVGLLLSYWQPIWSALGLDMGEFSVFLICPVATTLTLLIAAIVSRLTNRPSAPPLPEDVQ